MKTQTTHLPSLPLPSLTTAFRPHPARARFAAPFGMAGLALTPLTSEAMGTKQGFLVDGMVNHLGATNKPGQLPGHVRSWDGTGWSPASASNR